MGLIDKVRNAKKAIDLSAAKKKIEKQSKNFKKIDLDLERLNNRFSWLNDVNNTNKPNNPGHNRYHPNYQGKGRETRVSEGPNFRRVFNFQDVNINGKTRRMETKTSDFNKKDNILTIIQNNEQDAIERIYNYNNGSVTTRRYASDNPYNHINADNLVSEEVRKMDVSNRKSHEKNPYRKNVHHPTRADGFTGNIVKEPVRTRKVQDNPHLRKGTKSYRTNGASVQDKSPLNVRELKSGESIVYGSSGFIEYEGAINKNGRLIDSTATVMGDTGQTKNYNLLDKGGQAEEFKRLIGDGAAEGYEFPYWARKQAGIKNKPKGKTKTEPVISETAEKFEFTQDPKKRAERLKREKEQYEAEHPNRQPAKRRSDIPKKEIEKADLEKGVLNRKRNGSTGYRSQVKEINGVRTTTEFDAGLLTSRTVGRLDKNKNINDVLKIRGNNLILNRYDYNKNTLTSYKYELGKDIKVDKSGLGEQHIDTLINNGYLDRASEIKTTKFKSKEENLEEVKQKVTAAKLEKEREIRRNAYYENDADIWNENAGKEKLSEAYQEKAKNIIEGREQREAEKAKVRAERETERQARIDRQSERAKQRLENSNVSDEVHEPEPEKVEEAKTESTPEPEPQPEPEKNTKTKEKTEKEKQFDKELDDTLRYSQEMNYHINQNDAVKKQIQKDLQEGKIDAEEARRRYEQAHNDFMTHLEELDKKYDTGGQKQTEKVVENATKTGEESVKKSKKTFDDVVDQAKNARKEKWEKEGKTNPQYNQQKKYKNYEKGKPQTLNDLRKGAVEAREKKWAKDNPTKPRYNQQYSAEEIIKDAIKNPPPPPKQKKTVLQQTKDTYKEIKDVLANNRRAKRQNVFNLSKKGKYEYLNVRTSQGRVGIVRNRRNGNIIERSFTSTGEDELRYVMTHNKNGILESEMYNSKNTIGNKIERYKRGKQGERKISGAAFIDADEIDDARRRAEEAFEEAGNIAKRRKADWSESDADAFNLDVTAERDKWWEGGGSNFEPYTAEERNFINEREKMFKDNLDTAEQDLSGFKENNKGKEKELRKKVSDLEKQVDDPRLTTVQKDKARRELADASDELDKFKNQKKALKDKRKKAKQDYNNRNTEGKINQELKDLAENDFSGKLEQLEGIDLTQLSDKEKAKIESEIKAAKEGLTKEQALSKLKRNVTKSKRDISKMSPSEFVKEIGVGGVISGLTAVGTYKDNRREGRSVLSSAARAGVDFVLSETLGFGAYMALNLVKEVPDLAVKGTAALFKETRRMNSAARFSTFGDASFQDTQQLATMRQSGMELAKMSQYRLEQTLMGNEAKYLHR